ncbi:hypothetical protein HRbin04_00527 [archaeon HR04]|nr:hypothetical protein HRbin04_00527 [archaeon HR04]
MVLDEKRVPKEIYEWLISESLNLDVEGLRKRGNKKES